VAHWRSFFLPVRFSDGGALFPRLWPSPYFCASPLFVCLPSVHDIYTGSQPGCASLLAATQLLSSLSFSTVPLWQCLFLLDPTQGLVPLKFILPLAFPSCGHPPSSRSGFFELHAGCFLASFGSVALVYRWSPGSYFSMKFSPSAFGISGVLPASSCAVFHHFPVITWAAPLNPSDECSLDDVYFPFEPFFPIDLFHQWGWPPRL